MATDTMIRAVRRAIAWRRAPWAVPALLLLALSVSCENSLQVTNPQNFTSTALDNPKILQAVADGVEGSLHTAFGAYPIAMGLMSDELQDASTWINYADLSLGRFTALNVPTGGYDGQQAVLLRVRADAADAQARFVRVLGADAAAKSPMTAQVQVSAAFADLLNAMENCESSLTVNGPAAPDSAVYKQALSEFTTAMATAQAAGATAYLNWARAGRARTNLFLGNLDAAAADAAAVPQGFVKQTLYSVNSSYNPGNLINQNFNRTATVRMKWWPMIDTSNVGVVPTPSQYIKDPWTQANDPRMAVLHTRGTLGVSNQILYYSTQKYADRTAPMTLISKREMNLIQAEVYWRKGDFANAVAMMNIDRTANGLAPFSATGLSSDDVFQRLLSERFAVMFVEGMRMVDLNRFNLITQYLGSGRAKKFTLSTAEALYNTSINNAPRSCPAIS